MTERSRTPPRRDDGSDTRHEQVVFSFGEEVKPTLKFDAAAVTADAGLAPLRELDERLGLAALAVTFIEDFRQPEMIVHPIDRANEVKLHPIAMAHNLFAAARVMLPAEHELKRATVARLRITLVKCGATLVRTVRRSWLHAIGFFFVKLKLAIQATAVLSRVWCLFLLKLRDARTASSRLYPNF